MFDAGVSCGAILTLLRNSDWKDALELLQHLRDAEYTRGRADGAVEMGERLVPMKRPA